MSLVDILQGIETWMESQGFESVADCRGLVSARSVPNPAEFERANYVQVLDSYTPAPGILT